ncbi:MAG: tRNA (adenosine(37)-N6)-dimethylallyltransferase MiaA [Dongiaceae bacterium]
MANQAIVIGGPTASRKSALALAFAQSMNGVIINADSMQVYREIPLLTAQPPADSRQLISHRLYGFMSIAEACTAARWAALARQEIKATLAAGRLPILVGGTGFYLKAVLDGLAAIPEIPAPIRAAARARLTELGGRAFHAEIAARDPVSAARIQPTDRQRMVRAWEVFEATGRPLADWQANARPWHLDAGPSIQKIVVMPERAALYAACNARFAAMVRQGALAEARAVQALAVDPELPGMKALGLRELIDHLNGRAELAESVARTQQATRNYAKRQLTWFRHQMPDAKVIVPESLVEQFSERFLSEIFNNIRNSG